MRLRHEWLLLTASLDLGCGPVRGPAQATDGSDGQYASDGMDVATTAVSATLEGSESDGEASAGGEEELNCDETATWLSVQAIGDVSWGRMADGVSWVWGGSPLDNLGLRVPARLPPPMTSWTLVTFAHGNPIMLDPDRRMWRVHGEDAKQVADGYRWAQFSRSCGVTADGELLCLGFEVDDIQAVSIDFLGSGVVAVADHSYSGSSDRGHGCAVDEEGTAMCWGSNEWGQLGDGTDVSRDMLAPVLLDMPVQQVGVGRDFSCALADGSIYCWGLNTLGFLGIGFGPPYGAYIPVPTRIDGDNGDWTALSVNHDSACALREGGSVWCWGKRWGVGSVYGEAHAPERIDNETWLDISTGRGHNCGRRSDATVWCWGSNLMGQLGDGTITHGDMDRDGYDGAIEQGVPRPVCLVR